ncbi:MAG TPA: DUF3168 domain-containing protein [Longimicrobiales bacterium]|nr:DUF3168 domain-containing protein [Longimicrobiales bacterium]
MIEEGLASFLEELETSAGARVYPLTLPQAVKYPALTYQLVSDPRDDTHDGPDGTVNARYQVTAWSDVYDDMKALAQEVRDGLFGFTGAMGEVTVRRVGYMGGPDLYEPEVGPAGAPGVHHGPRDYVIQYTE